MRGHLSDKKKKLTSFTCDFVFSILFDILFWDKMAQSRLPSLGTIFTRVKGLLKAGAMKEKEKPIWYDIYAAFPPRFSVREIDPQVLSSPVKPIFYPEDRIRA